MKKFVLTIAIAFAVTLASAQGARLNLYSHYVFDDSYNSYYDSYNYYDGKIKGGYQWGAGIEYLMHHYCVELMYLHQTTHAPTYYQEGLANGSKYENFDLNIDYILLGSDGHYFHPNGKVEGYAGIFAGVGILGLKNDANGNSASSTRFAWGMRMGGNLWSAGKIGLKIQAQLLSISQGAGGGFYFGTGGTGVGVSSYSTIYQFELGGGLTFKFGTPKK
jgi:hypothetical protein